MGGEKKVRDQKKHCAEKSEVFGVRRQKQQFFDILSTWKTDEAYFLIQWQD